MKFWMQIRFALFLSHLMKISYYLCFIIIIIIRSSSYYEIGSFFVLFVSILASRLYAAD